jgi:hypothetical protein
MKKQPVTFTVALGFILLNLAIWLIFAVLVLIGVRPFSSLPDALRWILAALAVIASVIIGALIILLRRRNRIAFHLTLVVLVGLVLLTFMDQVGLIDLAYLVVALAPFVLLLISRRWYFQNDSKKK